MGGSAHCLCVLAFMDEVLCFELYNGLLFRLQGKFLKLQKCETHDYFPFF